MGTFHIPAIEPPDRMWGDAAGLVRVNANTLLVGFIVILIVVMGGYTFASPGHAPAQNTVTSDDSGPYHVVVSESTVGGGPVFRRSILAVLKPIMSIWGANNNERR